MVRPNTPASELLDAGAQLDAIVASGRAPDPTDSRELPAHLERVRRQVVEKHPPSSAARANDGVAPPISDLGGGATSTARHEPDASIMIVLLVALPALVVGFLLGQQVSLTSLAGWL